MIRFMIIFLILLASVYLGVQLSHDPGYLLITINKWSIETTLWVAIAALLITFFVMHTFLLFVNWTINIPTSWKRWRAKRRAHKAQSKTRQGLIEFSEGYWLQAKNHLIKALPDTDTPLFNYLTAARAAQEMGDNELRDDYLREAQQSMPDAKIAVELTQAQLQLANKQWEQALATLKHLQTLAPHHPYVLKLLMHLYEEVKDWPQLIGLLPELKQNHIVKGNEFKRLQQHVYLQAVNDLIKQDQMLTLKDIMEKLPKNLSHDPELVAVYGRYLLEKSQYADAEVLIRRSLRKHFNDQLIELYGLIKNDVAQLGFIESLAKEYGRSAALQLCLGRLCEHKHLWGKARTYFEESIRLGASPAAYAALGTLLAQINEEQASYQAFRSGLLLALHKGKE